MKSCSSPVRIHLMLLLLISISASCLAADPLYISPFGNSSYYKKRTSEKDFSFSPDYDFSTHCIRLGDEHLLRISYWKNKTSTEELFTVKNKLLCSGFYLNSNGHTRLLNKENQVLADRTENTWTCTDPETGITLSCTARATDTVFGGVQRRAALTVLKKGKGLTVKEVYIDGYGLCILVINGTIYTQLLGDYDVKKEMMTTMGYSDPMACLLVNEANQVFFKDRMKERYNEVLELTRSSRASEKATRATLLKNEMILRQLSASMSRIFDGTDYDAHTRKTIAYTYSLFSSLVISSLQQETKEEEKAWLLNAHRQRLFMSPGIDFIDNTIINGEAWEKNQQNYCRSIRQLAYALTDTLLRHPFFDQELVYLSEENSAALKTTWKGHPREQLVRHNEFLLNWITALCFHDLAANETNEYSKNYRLSTSFKSAYNSLYTLAENKDSAANDINDLPKEIEQALVAIIDESVNSDYVTKSPHDLWLLMCRLHDYTRAYKWFKIALKGYSIMYSDYYLPLLKEMTTALNNATEVTGLIASRETGIDKPDITTKCLVFLCFQNPLAAVEEIKKVRWGTIGFFIDEVNGQKVLREAFKTKQQPVLDFFYAEINNAFTLSKTPKKQYNPDTYETLKTLSSLTEEFGNRELSGKLFAYYQAMWKYR